MNEVPAVPERRYRRRILGLGASAFVVIFGLAAVVSVANVQNDLTGRVEETLVAGGIVGVDATFSGQDGTLTCRQRLDDPDAAGRVASRVEGVHRIELDATCSSAATDIGQPIDDVADEAMPDGSSDPTVAEPETLPDPEPVTEPEPATTPEPDPTPEPDLAPEPDPAPEVTGPTEPDLVVEPVPISLTAVLTGERLLLAGTVQSAQQRDAVTAAASALAVADPVDQIVIEPSVIATDGDVDRFAGAIGALNGTIAGEVVLDGGDVTVRGVVLDALSAAVLEGFGTDNDVDVDVDVRQTADVASAQGLEAEIAAFVTEQPVTFETGSDDLTPESSVVLAGVARRALGLEGISIDVVGHTDSAGTPGVNQQLSADRANQARLALVLLGLDPDAVTARGVGGLDAILVGGVEDPEASRRVEFFVGVTQP